jgi:hypothetical protein
MPAEVAIGEENGEREEDASCFCGQLGRGLSGTRELLCSSAGFLAWPKDMVVG